METSYLILSLTPTNFIPMELLDLRPMAATLYALMILGSMNSQLTLLRKNVKNSALIVSK